MGLISFVRTIFLSGPSAVSPAPFGVIGLILLLLLVVGTPVELLNPGTGLQSLAVSIGAYAVGIGLIWKGFDNLQFLRFIRDTPTSDIGSMASGNVELKAEARRLEDSYSAPFTDEQCVIYSYAIEESTGTGAGEWKTLDSDTSELLFAVEDGTGAAAVDASGADFRIDQEVEYVGAGEQPPDAIRDFLKQTDLGQSGDNLPAEKQRRYKQTLIRPGQDLYIFGEASSHGDSGVKQIRRGSSPIYVISDRDESDITGSLSLKYKLWLIFGLLVSMIGYTFLYVNLM